MESKKLKSLINAEEEHLATMSTSTTTTTKKKIIKKSSKAKQKLEVEQLEVRNSIEVVSANPEPSASAEPPTDMEISMTGTQSAKKIKSKKPKKCDYDNQNISVKSSFNKFDALQKRNLIHNNTEELRANCRQCNKPVYKMEEVIVQFKGEKGIYHRTCLRCRDCSKQLKPDNYQSHEGQLYCNMHFKLLFAPKVVPEEEKAKPRKAELIIRESQPVELPPDVARASDKPNLGLEELQQLNVRSRFQVFENGGTKCQAEEPPLPRQNSTVQRSASILSKLARLQQHGLLTTGPTNRDGDADSDRGATEGEVDEEEDDDDDDDDGDLALVRSRKHTERERPVGLGEAMNDIKTKFEQGHLMSKEERREERKQEIQNIRSRLFMGKQAKIKEMYQQAVAESEQGITSVGKKAEVEIGAAARSIKERFEKGEMFGVKGTQALDTGSNSGGLLEDADVFESAISKKSRCIFMELDANVTSRPTLQKTRSDSKCPSHSQTGQENADLDVVKCDEKPEDVKIATAELSEKFKFFESYRPNETEKRQFRMTPPREGVVKMPTPDSDSDAEVKQFQDNVLQKTQTTSTMLNKFREMERGARPGNEPMQPKPLKCFTPPPAEDQRYYERSSDSDEEGDSDEATNSYDGESDGEKGNDQSLIEAQMATRAKQLRAKFEKWQATEIERELNENRVDVYSQHVSDDSTIESAKTIRERFENMKNADRQSPTVPRYQVNRFV